jgi:hypothetical protein
MDYTVIDNFLDTDTFLNVKDSIYGSTFPWFHNEHVIYPPLDEADTWSWQLTHMFYYKVPVSDRLHLLEPILLKLNPSAILRIKANLTPRADKIIQHGFHVDISHFKGKTAIYYINTTNGYTVFENGTKIESVENRMVIFDSTIKHTGTTCTDSRNRCVINFNYYEWN